MKIQRERWGLIRDNEKIFCGRAKSYEFRAIEDLRDIAVTTYLSKNKAIASFIRSWWRGKELIESGEAHDPYDGVKGLFSMLYFKFVSKGYIFVEDEVEDERNEGF